MKLKRLWALALSLALLAGCGASGPATAEAGDAPLTARAPLTGQTALWPGQRPVAVTVENDPAARLRGIGDASLVLEALTGSGDTPSLCLVFPSAAATPRVGPVAPGQDLFFQLLAAQQPIPVQRGAGVYGGNLLDQYGIRAVDALEAGVLAFEYEGVWGQSDALSWYTDGALLSGVLSALGIDPQAEADPLAAAADAGAAGEDDASGLSAAALPPLLPFGDRDTAEEGEAAPGVEIRFSSTASTGFTYDSAGGVYRMTGADGAPRVDANTGQQAAFDNLLLLYSAPTLRDDGRTWGYDLTMGGGYYLTGGEAWSILWTQGADSTLGIFNAGGQAVTIQPGRSYIAVLGSLPEQEIIFPQ